MGGMVSKYVAVHEITLISPMEALTSKLVENLQHLINLLYMIQNLFAGHINLVRSVYTLQRFIKLRNSMLMYFIINLANISLQISAG